MTALYVRGVTEQARMYRRNILRYCELVQVRCLIKPYSQIHGIQLDAALTKQRHQVASTWTEQKNPIELPLRADSHSAV